MKQRKYFKFFIAVLLSIGFCSFTTATYADQTESDDQNIQDITLTLLPKEEEKYISNTENTIKNLPKMNEKPRMLLEKSGLLLIFLTIFSYSIIKRKREN